MSGKYQNRKVGLSKGEVGIVRTRKVEEGEADVIDEVNVSSCLPLDRAIECRCKDPLMFVGFGDTAG